MVVAERSEWIIVPAPHLGDTYFTCALASAFLKQHGGSRVRVAVPKSLWGIVRLFEGEPVSATDPDAIEVPVLKTRGTSPADPFELRPIDHWNYFTFRYFGQRLPFTRMYHDLLELAFPSFAPPEVPGDIRRSAEDRMKSLDLPAGKSVILVPFSKSLASFEPNFWERLAETLKSRGYVVATNVTASQMDSCIQGTRPLQCPGEELISVAEMAGMVIASRCGVCDILSTAQTDLRILYQSPQMEKLRMPGVTLEWDLGPCGLQDRATYYRMQLHEPNGDFIQRILSTAS